MTRTAPGKVRFSNLNHTRDMNEAISLIGQRIHSWQVLGDSGKRQLPSGKMVHMVWCRCDCGNEREVFNSSLRSGNSKSCGCQRAKNFVVSRTRHGHATRGMPTAEYKTWSSIIDRCENNRCESFELYGQRGIKLCKSWRKSFANFFADMGPRPSPNHSLDRIDNNGDYTPQNCRWATPQEQQGNRRNNVIIECGGISKIAAEWSRISGVAADTIIRRIRFQKLTPSMAIWTPVAKRYRKETA